MKTEILLAERDKATEALQESEQRYKRLLEATTDYIYTVQLEGGQTRSTSHGPGCEAVTGYSPEDFARNPYLWYQIVHGEDRPLVMKQIEHILKGELPPPLEHRIIRRNGTVRWIRNRTIPHYSDNGKLYGYDGLITDITDRKVSEEALRESQERLSLVIRGSTDGIWDWNIRTGEIWFSPRWKSMLGYAENEIANRFSVWEELMHPEDLPKARERVRAYLASTIPAYELEHRLRHKDGTYRWMLARGVVLRDPDQHPIRMAGSHVDVTELRNSTEQLQKANRDLLETRDQLVLAARFESMGTLAAGVAHEVKNPLQTILMGLHFLARKLDGVDEDVLLTLKDMRESVTHADAIVGDLLKLSRVTTFQTRPNSLNRVIQHCLRLMKIEIDAAGVIPRLQLQPDLPDVMLDETKMEQVFLNLFLNAVQAMPGGGTLGVITRALVLDRDPATTPPLLRKFRPGQRVVLAEVRDTGPGIKPADLPRVFDAFFTTKQVGVGTGLGLPIARMIVDRHGGVIDLANSAQGGVLVTVALKSEPGVA